MTLTVAQFIVWLNEPSCNSRREIVEAIMRIEAIDRRLDRARRG